LSDENRSSEATSIGGSEPTRSKFPNALDFSTMGIGALACLVLISDNAAIPLLIADLTPLVAIASLILVVGTALKRRPRLVVSTAVAAALIAAGRITPDLVTAVATPPSSGSEDGELLKVVTANLWSSNRNAEPFLRFVQDEQPDILVLQEGYAPWKHHLEKLAPSYRIVAGCARPHTCNVIVLSRLDAKVTSHNETACCLMTTLALPRRLGGAPINIVGLHLSRTDDRKKRESELAVALEQAATLGSRGILAGDMNAVPWSTTIRQLDQASGLSRVTRFTPSWPTPQGLFPLAPIDHIYVGCGWRPTSLRLGPDIGSDHYPIVTTLAAKPCGDG